MGLMAMAHVLLMATTLEQGPGGWDCSCRQMGRDALPPGDSRAPGTCQISPARTRTTAATVKYVNVDGGFVLGQRVPPVPGGADGNVPGTLTEKVGVPARNEQGENQPRVTRGSVYRSTIPGPQQGGALR